LLAILVLAGCAERDLWPEERLDPKTAVNITIMAEPWIYSRDVPMLAANARDYLSVGVVETNRAGIRAYWLGIIAWSTIDRSVLPGPAAIILPAKARLLWPAAKLELIPDSKGRSAPGLTDPVFIDKDMKFTEAWYPLSPAQLAQLGESAPTAIAIIGDAGQPATYETWQVRAAAMSEFLKATGS
jgi:DNA polymerase III psi subunit